MSRFLGVSFLENLERENQFPEEPTLDEQMDASIEDILAEFKEDGALEDWDTPITPEEDKLPQDEGREDPATTNDKVAPWQGTVLMYLHDLAYLLAGLVVVFLLLFRVVVVSGTSMNSTLLDGDYLLVLSNTFYHNPACGDVIVASKESFDNGSPIVKRVIATEGQWVDIDFAAGIVYVGDTPDTMVALDEPYTKTPTNTAEGIKFPLQVQEGCLFVMGDNRNGSKDSRHPEIGQIDKREVLGKVFFLFLPGTNYEQVPMDFSRIGVVG